MWSSRGRALRGIGGVSVAVAFVGSVLAFAALPRAGAIGQPPTSTNHTTTQPADTLALLPADFGTVFGTAAGAAEPSASKPSALQPVGHVRPKRDPVAIVMPITGVTPRGGFGTRGPMWAVAHSGLDFSAGIGTPAVAVVSGTIRAVFMHPSFGWVEELERSDGVEFWYCHLSQPIAEPAQVVTQGQVLGLTGDTGNTSGPHLHFEVRVDGVPTDPADFLFNHPGTPGQSPSWAYAYRQEPPPGHTIVGWPPSKEELAKRRAEKEQAAREIAAREKAAKDKQHRGNQTGKPTPTPDASSGNPDGGGTATPSPPHSAPAQEPAPEESAAASVG